MSTVLNDFCEEVKVDYENIIKSGESAGNIQKEKKISFGLLSMIKTNSPYASSMLLDANVVFYHKKENEEESINVKFLADSLENYFDYLKNKEEFKSHVNQMSFLVRIYDENNAVISESKTDFGFVKSVDIEKEKEKLHAEIKDTATLNRPQDTRI